MDSYAASNSRHHENDSLRRLRAQLEIESSDSLGLLRDIENNPICSIKLDESVPCIIVVWRQYATSNQLRFVHEMILELVKKYHVTKVLGDDTKLPTIHREDQSWIVSNWMPRAVGAGLKFACSKAPKAHFGRVAVSSIQSTAPRELITRSFENFDDAQHWLQNINSI